MGEAASRELRNDTAGLLRRVEAGEVITVTVTGRPVAALHPLDSRTTWVARAAFVARFGGALADPTLREDLVELAPDTTDDVVLR